MTARSQQKFQRYQIDIVPTAEDIDTVVQGIRTRESVYAKWAANTGETNEEDDELDRLSDCLWWAEVSVPTLRSRRMRGYGGGHTEAEAVAAAWVSAHLSDAGDPGAWWCSWPDEERLNAVPRELPPGLVFEITSSPEARKGN